MFERPTDQERPFVQAICATPADDAPRLIFADWLEDRGDRRGEYLRAAVAIELAIDGLGWGFAFASWREFLPQVLDSPQTAEALSAAPRVPRIKTGDLTTAQRRRIARPYRCGGFIENVSLTPEALLDHGVYLRGAFPLRGLISGARPAPLGGLELDHHTPETWRGIERLVISGSASLPGYSFAPFASEFDGTDFASTAFDLTAVATYLPSLFDARGFYSFLRRSSLRSLLFLADEVSISGREGLLENWQPIDLRCFGAPRTSLPEHAILELACWPGLANLRLLDLSTSRFTPKAWKALAESPFRRDGLVVIHASDDVRRDPADFAIRSILNCYSGANSFPDAFDF